MPCSFYLFTFFFFGVLSVCHIFFVVRKLYSKSASKTKEVIPILYLYAYLCPWLLLFLKLLQMASGVSIDRERNERARYTRMSCIPRVSLVCPSTKLETTRGLQLLVFIYDYIFKPHSQELYLCLDKLETKFLRFLCCLCFLSRHQSKITWG